MKKLLVFAAALAVAGCFAVTGYAATDTTEHNVDIIVEEVALINDVGVDPDFTIDAPVAAVGGEPFVVTSNNEDAKWLQYSSIVADDGEKRKITVSIDDDDNIPAGTTLTVTAAEPAGAGNCGDLARSNPR